MFKRLRENAEKCSTPIENIELCIPLSVSSVSSIGSSPHERIIESDKSVDEYYALKERSICSESVISCTTIGINSDAKKRKRNDEINSVEKRFHHSDFSLKEDEKIIKFFKAEKTLLKLMFHKAVYVIMKKTCGFNRTWDELRSRFLGHIIPNLHQYSCLGIGDVVNMYQYISTELPESVESALVNILKSRGIDISNKLTDAYIQHSDDIHFIKIGNYVGFNINGKNHVIVPESDRDIYKLSCEQSDIQEQNVHFVENEEYTIYSNLQNLHHNLKESFSNIVESKFSKIRTRTEMNGLSISKNKTQSASQSSCENNVKDITPSQSSNKFTNTTNSSDVMYTCPTTPIPESTQINTQYFDCNTELNIFADSKKLSVKDMVNPMRTETSPLKQ